MRRDTNNFIIGNDTENFKFSDIGNFNIVYRLIVISYFLSFAWIMFYEVISDYFKTRYGFSTDQTGQFIGSISMVAFIFALIVAYLWDRVGYRLIFYIIGTSLITLSNILFAVIPASTSDNKSYAGIVPVVFLAVGINVYTAAKLPLMPVMIKSHTQGTALGLASCILNVIISLVPFFLEGLRNPEKNQNEYTIIFFRLFLMRLVLL